MSNSKKLTTDLEKYFFASTSSDHEINDYVIWCCWKMGHFQSIYECEPFNELNEFQQLTFEGLVSIHFDQQKKNSNASNTHQSIHQHPNKSKSYSSSTGKAIHIVPQYIHSIHSIHIQLFLYSFPSADTTCDKY